MKNAITLRFDAGKLPKYRKRKAHGNNHSEEKHDAGRVPRIARLMALAIHLQKLVEDGTVRDYAEIARLTGLTRARVTQIMNLTLLAPEIQEQILFLPRVENGCDPIAERNIRMIIAETFWPKQKSLWEELANNHPR